MVPLGEVARAAWRHPVVKAPSGAGPVQADRAWPSMLFSFFIWLQDQKVHRYKRSSRQGTSWNQPLARTSLAPLASKTSEHHMFSQPTTADQGTANGKEGLKHASITTVQDTIKVQRTEVRMRTIKEHTREVNNAKTRIHADSRQVRRHNYIPCNACTMQPDTTSRL